MARSALTLQNITLAGLTPALAAANVDGNMFTNDGTEFIDVANAAVGSMTVTVQTPGTVGGNLIADKVITVGAGVTKRIGPFPTDVYNQTTGADRGKVYLDYSSVTTVTVGAFHL